MKSNRFIIVVLMLIAFAFACKKDKKEATDSCGVPEFQNTASANVPNPCGIAVSTGGKVAITEYKQPYGSVGLTKIWNSYSDLLTKKAPAQTFQSTGAEAIAFDNNENLYVTETEGTASIVIYKKVVVPGGSTYQYLKRLQGGFNNPRGIAFDSKNRLFMADDGNDRLLRFDDPLNNDSFKIVAGVFGNPKGLAIANNTLYLTGYNTNLLYKYTINNAGGLDDLSRVMLDKPVDVAAYGSIVAIAAPESSTITLLNADQIKSTESNYTGCKKELKGSGPLYGLAFVKTSDGYGLLSAQYSKSQIAFYEP